MTSSCSWAFWVDSSNLYKYVRLMSPSFLISSTVLICCSFFKFFLMSSNNPVKYLAITVFAFVRSKSISRPLCLTTRASISCLASSAFLRSVLIFSNLVASAFLLSTFAFACLTFSSFRDSLASSFTSSSSASLTFTSDSAISSSSVL